MKKLLFLILFFSVSALTFSANVYFLNDGPGYLYTNGQTFYSNQYGYATVAYHIWADPTKYYVDEWGANFQDPDGNWSGWSHLSTGYGVHHCVEAGTWHAKGRVHVDHDIWGYSDYYMETSFVLYFYVVDNYSPAVPQNFDATVYHTENNAHPKLTWTLNTEADGDDYYIERRVTGQQNFSFLTTVNWTTNQYIDYSINYAGGGPALAEYKVRAHDINGNYSNYTNVESVQYGDAYKFGTGNIESTTNYKLEQNYPNPFNPETFINYQIKENGFVSLKVYDLIGQEVANLVDEVQSPGQYSISFDGSNLPSGIYIYSLRVNEFVQYIKMTLLK
jgi:hypothetical protein